MASEPQISYIKSLAEKRDLTNLDPYLKGTISTPLALQNLSNAQVSEILDALKKLPFKPAPQPAQVEIDPGKTYYYGHPDLDKIAAQTQQNNVAELKELESKVGKGRYFIVDPTDNVEKFFKVDKPVSPSRWAGYTFLSVQASDVFYKIKSPSHKIAVYKTILVDPVNAMNQYGIRLGFCGMCGRILTARDSRLRGIGPICADKIFAEQNQATEEQLDILDRLGLRPKDREEVDDDE